MIKKLIERYIQNIISEEESVNPIAKSEGIRIKTLNQKREAILERQQSIAKINAIFPTGQTSVMDSLNLYPATKIDNSNSQQVLDINTEYYKRQALRELNSINK